LEGRFFLIPCIKTGMPKHACFVLFPKANLTGFMDKHHYHQLLLKSCQVFRIYEKNEQESGRHFTEQPIQSPASKRRFLWKLILNFHNIIN
jgi:hypothetical protein